MGQGQKSSRGFTLVAALLILILLSGVAAGLLFLVTNESKMGGNDLEANLAYFDAESGMEKLTSDLGALYQANMVPTSAQIQALTTNPPSSSMVGSSTFTEQIIYPLGTDANGNPKSSYNTVSAGPNAGLYAEIVPLTMQVQAQRPSGATISMTRSVEVALIPVFQFGVFCGYDCSYFAGPNFSFGGRVHTNSSLFLASGANLVFNDKVEAYKQIVTDQLENGWPTSNGYTGTVYVPSTAGGCPLFPIPPTGSPNCKAMSSGVPGDASWSGGYPGLAGGTNGAFPNTTSIGKYNYFLANSLTGVGNLQLPFVQNSCVSNPPPCTDPISIVRKPLAGETPTSTLGSSRLYNKAQIRILIADTLKDLHPERGAGALDAQDVRLPNTTAFSVAPFNNAAVNLTAGGTEPVGFATVGQFGWVNPYTDAGLQNWAGVNNIPLMGELTDPVGGPATPAAMTGPWIRVEYLNNAGAWVGVTQEWLQLGFSRPFNLPPTTPGSNAVDPNAILILQQLRPSVAQAAASAHGTAAAVGGNFYPINFYDAREGEMRDTNVPNSTSGNNTYSSCSVNGIMNAVELDVGNLARWLNSAQVVATYGAIAGSGANVNYTKENGYVLYFSDHRGMLPSTHPSNGGQTPAGINNGESGIEDVINAAQATATTDGVLETSSNYYTYSPEDVDQNGFLDNWGEKNIGYGFGLNTNTAPLNPYQRLTPVTANLGTPNSNDCAAWTTTTKTLLTGVKDQQGMANPVSGARHVLKLVDGGMSAGLVSFVPVMPAASGCAQSAASPTGCGGFTVASENPVYVQGNYNTTSTDPFWGTANNATPTQTPHSAASVIADSVTVLSNTWTDAISLLYPTAMNCGTNGTERCAGTVDGVNYQDSYYRMAVSGGKNIPFLQPGFAGVAKDFGTDGGMHNFLRYLENVGNINLWYDGSLVSMYYAEYDTGTFKCCTTVYGAPSRKYFFDVLFLNPANLPPATPEFQDVVNLSYHQNFTPQ